MKHSERFVYERSSVLSSFITYSERFLLCECQVRALFDDNGKQVDEAGPSIPVQVN